MDKLIQWALSNRALVLVAALVLTAFGIHTATRMPVDVFPDLTAPTVTIITEAHGMSPTEVETQVTFPVETAVNGAAGVRRVRSATAVGISVVWVEFEWGTDIRHARQTVAEKIGAVSAELPPEVERPVLAPQSSIMGEILFLALSSDQHTPAELRSHAEVSIRRRLLAVPGVAQVTPIGGGEKQFQVVINPTALQAHGVTLNQVVRALEEANENVSAGIINERGAEWLVTGVGRVRSLEDIGATTVAAREGVPTLVRDLGEVRVGEAQKRGEGSAMGKPAVLLGIQKQPGANTLELTKRLDAALADISAKLPAGMKLKTDIFRQADFISVSVHNVQTALLEGVVLVTVVVLLFLGNFRATLITLTAIPLSLLTAVLTLKWFGASINTMTLGGMAIAIGALVDDAVIDVENVFRRLRENHHKPEARRRPILQVVFDASVEIRSSIVFATLIIALVFIPIFFLGGVEGRLLQPLGVAYLVALGASLIVAVTVTPVLCYLLLPKSRGVLAEHEPKFVQWLKAAYAPVLHGALAHPWRFTVPAVVVLAVALLAATRMGRAFLPEFNEGSLTISAVTLPGTSLPESDALGRVVEQTLLSFPEVVSVARRTGRAELDEHAQGVEASELEVSIAMKSRGKAEFLQALRDAFSTVPGMNITIGQPISHRIDHMLSGTRANIAVKIFGPDLYRLRTLAEKSRQAMQGVTGVVDLSVETQTEVPVLKIKFDRAEIARHALTIRDVARTVEASLQGVKATRVLEGQAAYDLVVRLADAGGWSLDTLGDLLVDTPAGAKVPLRSLARIQRDTGPNQILREQVERKIVVQCNVAGRDVTGVVQDIQKLVNPIVGAAGGFRVEYAGQFESAAEAGRTLTLVSIGVVIGIGFLLHLAFKSARDAALIMLNLPLALIGGVAGVFVGGGVLSVASLIGFITVFGIATRNGIMLVAHIRHLQEHEGMTDFREAVRRGAMERLVPILMTALAAGLALIPLALGGEKPGNEIQTPMAIVILFGLLTSMVLNMVIVPALYFRLGQPSSLQPNS
ncbi:MAG: CzcA family heavy metal efflux protein [Limisphaerales bacterium]|nr:MAG: CzcA family heavy metal efflux protein [Limisphaerales bacterium]KAG0509695.1 MAG: CzcA family heavy metal efflux protein [Limisphaerales bacterium]TXT51186.1 MAG: CzcA family heavy metal efflux protein [Limisphaerales bacterium]